MERPSFRFGGAVAPAYRSRAARGVLAVAAPLALAAGLSACSSSSSAASAKTAGTAAASGSCRGVSGAHHARVVVETAPGATSARCVGFSTPTVSALTLLGDAHVQLGTQKYSFGLAICQVDDVPAHYSQCLPKGQNYWALFVSNNGKPWTSPSVGVSDITVAPGGSLGLRYDPPTGTAAPPPPPSRA